MAKKNRSLAEQLRAEHGVEAPSFSSDMWDEEPVSLDVFVRDSKFLGNPPLFPEQYRFLRHLEQVLLPETYIAMVEEFGDYWTPVRSVNFAFAEWGKGSGKDHTCRVAATRIAYILSCMKEPQLYYGMAKQDIIHTINVAATADQARRAFFVPLGKMLTTSPWFQQHVVNEITELTRSIRLDKQIELISGHSQIESFEGLNLILAVADEISAFKAAAELEERGIRDSPRTAEAILGVLESSARTRFPKTFKVAAISYPRYKNDPIENLIHRAKVSEEEDPKKSKYLASGPFATWDIRPDRDREDFEDAFKTNYSEARAKYECMPERSEDRFMKNDVAIAKAFPPLDLENYALPLEIQYFWGREEEAEDTPSGEQFDGWQVRHVLGSQVYPLEGCLYSLHADLARVGDRAGVAMSHVRTWEFDETEEAMPDDRPIVKVDFLAAYESDPNIYNPEGDLAPREIQLRWFRQLVKYLIRQGFSVGSVTLDGWQSVETLQVLETWGIECKLQSVDRNAGPYRTLKELIEDDRLEAYCDPDRIIIDEIEGLTRLKNDKIDHPIGGSKDIADAVCGSVVGALTIGGDEGEEPVRADPQGNLELEIDGDLNPNSRFVGMGYNITQEDLVWNFS